MQFFKSLAPFVCFWTVGFVFFVCLYHSYTTEIQNLWELFEFWKTLLFLCFKWTCHFVTYTYCMNRFYASCLTTRNSTQKIQWKQWVKFVFYKELLDVVMLLRSAKRNINRNCSLRKLFSKAWKQNLVFWNSVSLALRFEVDCRNRIDRFLFVLYYIYFVGLSIIPLAMFLCG